MTPAPEPYRHIRIVLWGTVLANGLFLPFDLTWPDRWTAAGLRLAWMAWLAGTALLQGRVSAAAARRATLLATLVSAVVGSAIVAFAGGVLGPRGGFLMAMPLAVLVLLPEEPWAGALAGLGSAASGVALLLGEGATPLRAVEWLSLSVILSALATAGSIAFRRIWQARLVAERERAEALEKLRESERFRLLTEQDARLALLAAELAHEINSPLAAVRAGVSFVDTELRTHELAHGELSPALADSRAGVARIQAVVSDFSAAATAPAAGAGRAQLDHAIREGLRMATVRHGAFGLRRTEDAPLPAVVGDTSLLSLAVMHLVLAALASGAGAVELRAWRDGGTALLSVEPVAGSPAAGGAAAARGRDLPLALADELLRRCSGSLRHGAAAGALVAALPLAAP